MNPNYCHIISLYRDRDGAWERTVLRNCFWKAGIAITQDGTNVRQVNTYTVRIPLEEAGTGFLVSVNDIVVLGECTDTITGKTPNTATEVLLRNKPQAFRITAFSDNTSHRVGKHYRLGG